MDRTGAYSPNDRRRPSLFAIRNSVVVKSWLFLPGQLDESCLLVFYRLDAAEAEMVRGKIRKTGGPIYKTLKTAKLFPQPNDNRGQRNDNQENHSETAQSCGSDDSLPRRKGVDEVFRFLESNSGFFPIELDGLDLAALLQKREDLALEGRIGGFA